eukprot:INCI12821.1.p1 GENE.INCI12821.1~~INCI12821.1.p1  ORF type:complete len:621 (+),score=80.38 INCI12821.1:435-2297(+)
MAASGSPAVGALQVSIAAIGPKPKSPILRKLLFPEQFSGAHVASGGFFQTLPDHHRRAQSQSLTYSQFTQQFARSGRQPLCGDAAPGMGRTSGRTAPSIVHVVPIGLSQQPDGTPQTRLLDKISRYIQAQLHPLVVRLSWLPDVDTRQARFFTQRSPSGAEAMLNVFAVMDLLKRKFATAMEAGPVGMFGQKTFVLGISPFAPNARVPQAPVQTVSIAFLPGLQQIAASADSVWPSGPLPGPQNMQLQRWCASIGTHCLVSIASLPIGCSWFRCRLNDGRPPESGGSPVAFCWHLCPVCLRKLLLVLGGTGKPDLVLTRYALLEKSYAQMGATQAVQWVSDRRREATGHAPNPQSSGQYGGHNGHAANLSGQSQAGHSGGDSIRVSDIERRLQQSQGRDVTYGEILQLERAYGINVVPMDVKNFKEKRQVATDKLLQYLEQKRNHPAPGGKVGANSIGQREQAEHLGTHVQNSAPSLDREVTMQLDAACAGNYQWTEQIMHDQTSGSPLQPQHSPLPPHVQEFIARVSSGRGQDLSFGQLQQIATATGYDIMPKEFDSFQDRRRRAFEALKAIVHAPTAEAVAQRQKKTIFVDGSNESIAQAQKESQVCCLVSERNAFDA